MGLALTNHYLKDGHEVVAIVRQQASIMREAGISKRLAKRLFVFEGDVRDASRMRAVIHGIVSGLGPIDVLIANAGIGDQRLTTCLDIERVDQVVQTNFQGACNVIAPAAKHMVARRRGQIVAISSLASVVTIPRMSTYTAAKAALNAQMEGLYWDLRPMGIAVTTVCPGFVATDMLHGHGVPERWLMRQDECVKRIAVAIAGRKRLVHFPRWLHGLMLFVRMCPVPLRGVIFNHVFERWFPRPDRPPQPAFAPNREETHA
ncbi:MAG: SDR family NAD(P)-dependent oxidoreductase [Pseudomonadota bacterium]